MCNTWQNFQKLVILLTATADMHAVLTRTPTNWVKRHDVELYFNQTPASP